MLNIKKGLNCESGSQNRADNYIDDEHHLWLTGECDRTRRQWSQGNSDGYFGPDLLPRKIRVRHDWLVEDLDEWNRDSHRTVQGW